MSNNLNPHQFGGGTEGIPGHLDIDYDRRQVRLGGHPIPAAGVTAWHDGDWTVKVPLENGHIAAVHTYSPHGSTGPEPYDRPITVAMHQVYGDAPDVEDEDYERTHILRSGEEAYKSRLTGEEAFHTLRQWAQEPSPAEYHLQSNRQHIKDAEWVRYTD